MSALNKDVHIDRGLFLRALAPCMTCNNNETMGELWESSVLHMVGAVPGARTQSRLSAVVRIGLGFIGIHASSYLARSDVLGRRHDGCTTGRTDCHEQICIHAQQPHKQSRQYTAITLRQVRAAVKMLTSLAEIAGQGNACLRPLKDVKEHASLLRKKAVTLWPGAGRSQEYRESILQPRCPDGV